MKYFLKLKTMQKIHKEEILKCFIETGSVLLIFPSVAESNMAWQDTSSHSH